MWKQLDHPAGGVGNDSQDSPVPYMAVDGRSVWLSTACAPWDFQTVWTGAAKTDASKAAIAANAADDDPTNDYPKVTYWCASTHTTPDRQCYKSTNGGQSFTEIGGTPSNDKAGTSGAVSAGPDGTLYGLGSAGLKVSKDEGETWTTKPFPAELGAIGLGGNPGTNPAIDKDGNIYVVGVTAGKPSLIVTSDEGDHWTVFKDIQYRGVQTIDKIAVAADYFHPGRVVVAYLGNTEANASSPNGTIHHAYGLPQPMAGGPRHGYMTFGDVFKTPGRFVSTQVDPETDAVMPHGFPLTPGIDYIGAWFSDDGRPWAYFPSEYCGSMACATERLDLNATYTEWVGAIATLTGKGLALPKR
jgi:hypothetical protein